MGRGREKNAEKDSGGEKSSFVTRVHGEMIVRAIKLAPVMQSAVANINAFFFGGFGLE